MKNTKPGLPPLTGREPEILILGSFPSLMSLGKGEYYGNPKNQFWKITEILFGIDYTLPYTTRIALLVENHVALWDVLASCDRDGSMDSTIRDAVANDIRGFMAIHPTIRCIALNGSTAGRYFKRLNPGLTGHVLPSTSPAFARMSLTEKARCWARICIPKPS
jgi:TDG/mug DNA glycosylase family protein